MAGTRWTPWDVGYYHNPKARAAGKNGRALHHASVCWSADNLQDGRVPASTLTLLCSLAEVPKSTAKRLVETGLWEPLPDETGWVIHDFLEHNKSRADVEHERSKWARKKAEQRGMSPGDSNGDNSECPPGSPPNKTKTDRQTDLTPSYVSDKTDDSLPGQQPSSSLNPMQTVAWQLARYQAKDTPPDNFRAWFTSTRRGILEERTEQIAAALASNDGDIDAAVNALLPRRNGSTSKPVREAWYSDPECELCEGEGFVKDDNGFMIECTCRRHEPYPKRTKLRSVK